MADIPSDLLKRAQAAQFLNIPQDSLASDVTRGHLGVPYLKIGNSVRYSKTELNAWLKHQQKTPPGSQALTLQDLLDPVDRVLNNKQALQLLSDLAEGTTIALPALKIMRKEIPAPLLADARMFIEILSDSVKELEVEYL
ncbi:MAG: helix-turn-helix domain-containing protein [Sulfuricella sp.]